MIAQQAGGELVTWVEGAYAQNVNRRQSLERYFFALWQCPKPSKTQWIWALYRTRGSLPEDDARPWVVSRCATEREAREEALHHAAGFKAESGARVGPGVGAAGV